TFGSNLGFKFAQQKNIPLNVIYDSPVSEQEEFFKGTKVVHKDLVAKNEFNTLTYAKSIVIYSEPVKKFLKDLYDLKDDQFHIHQNVDFTRFDYLPTSKDLSKGINICFLGSFLKWHRVDLLIEVFESLCKKFDHIHLHLIGEGMEFENISNQVFKSQWKNKISPPGFLDGEALKNYKSLMHIGLMPGSNWYGAPNKIFEYGAAGMAVITCKSPTICYLFSEKLVTFFEMGDKQELTNALDELI